MNAFTWLLQTELAGFAVSLCKGGGILAAGWLIARGVSSGIEKALPRVGFKTDALLFLGNLAYYTIVLLSLTAALSEMGIDTNSILAILGGAGLAVGLGLKDQLSQLTAGIVLLIKHPFKLGDFVTLAGETGIVFSMDVFQTTLRTKDGKRVTLPNSMAMGSVITNYSAFPQRRIEVPITVHYSDNISMAKGILLQIILSQKLVSDFPAPDVVVSAYREHGVELTARCWVNSTDFPSVRFTLLEEMLVQMQKQGFHIPLSQLVIQRKAASA